MRVEELPPRGDDARTNRIHTAASVADGGSANTPIEPTATENDAASNQQIPDDAVESGPTPLSSPRINRRVAIAFVVAIMAGMTFLVVGGKIGTIGACAGLSIMVITGMLLMQSANRLENLVAPLSRELEGEKLAHKLTRRDAKKANDGFEERLRVLARSNVTEMGKVRAENRELDTKVQGLEQKIKGFVPRPVAKALLKLLLTQHPRVRPHNIFEIKADGKAVQINLADEETAGRPAVSVELLGEASVGNEKPPYMYVRLYEGAFIWGNVVINVMRDEDRWGLVVCRYIAGVPDWDNAVSVELGRDQSIVGIGKIFATGNVLEANRHFIQNVPAWVFPVDESGPIEERTINPTDIAGRLQKMRAEWKPAGRAVPLATAHPAANGLGRPPVAPPSNGG